MKKRIERIAFIVLDLLPCLLTVGFSAFVVLKNQFSPMGTDKLLEWVLAVLALLGTSLLVERFTRLRRIEKITEQTYELLNNGSKLTSLDSIIQNRKSLSPLEERLADAKRIMISGGSLFRLATEYLGFFEDMAAGGCSFQFILVDPESDSAIVVANQIVYEVKNAEAYSANIRMALKNLESLKQKYPKQVDIRLVNYVPPFSLMVCDPHKKNGSIRVELYTMAVPTRERPHFHIRKNAEPQCFKFFLDQYEQLWKMAEPTR
jgi:hypothetical protein